MQLYIKNNDSKETLLLVGVVKEKSKLENFLTEGGNSKPVRNVLRPGEDCNYTLEEDYFLGIEIL
jgi:hypothetical protein